MGKKESIEHQDNIYELDKWYDKKAKDNKKQKAEKQKFSDTNIKPKRKGKVVGIDKENENSLKLSVRLSNGQTFEQILDTGGPNNKKEWENLCDYLGIYPEPSEMLGQYIPVNIPTASDFLIDCEVDNFIYPTRSAHRISKKDINQPQIDVPPVMGGLNPTVYRYKRKIIPYAKNSDIIKNIIEKTIQSTPYIIPLFFLFTGFSLLSASKSLGLLSLLTAPLSIFIIILSLFFVTAAIENMVIKLLVELPNLCTEKYNSLKKKIFP